MEGIWPSREIPFQCFEAQHAMSSFQTEVFIAKFTWTEFI